MPEKVADILKKHTKYNFFQAVYLLKEYWPNKIKFIPSFRIDYPASSIADCFLENDIIILSLNFMGLYGVDSPLPSYFLSYTKGRNNELEMERSFFDIFNQRIYELLYLAWEKCYCKYPAQDISATLQSLNLVTLKRRISSFMGEKSVVIHQFIPCWMPVISGSKLGEDVVLGGKVTTISYKIIIDIGPVAFDFANLFLEDSRKKDRVKRVVTDFLEINIIFELRLIVRLRTNVNLLLGITNICLNGLFVLGKNSMDLLTIVF